MTSDAAKLLATWNGCGYYRLVGMEVSRADDTGSAFSIDIDDQHLQAYGTAHGGILAGLIDAAMGLDNAPPAQLLLRVVLNELNRFTGDHAADDDRTILAAVAV